MHIISKDDQNLVILKDLGVQTEADLSFLTSKHAINYVKELEQSLHGGSKGKQKISPIEQRADRMAEKLTHNSEEMCEIMKNFLQLNPFMRMTAFECIMKCRIFDDVRVRSKENFLKKLQEISFQDLSKKNGAYKAPKVNKNNLQANINQNVQSVAAPNLLQKNSPKRSAMFDKNYANSTTENTRLNENGSPTADAQSILKKAKYKNYDVDYHIELQIDTADAFDYEDLRNAKYAIDELKAMLIEQIQYFENRVNY